MGNAAPQVKTGGAAAQRDPLNYIQHDMPKLMKKSELGTGKFMKSFLCKVEEGVPIVVKVYVRHEGEREEGIFRAKAGVEEVRLKLAALDSPNVLPYQQAIVGEQIRGARFTSAAYVVRQHFYTSLNDRLSMRPFLSAVEKKWIVYQLMVAAKQAHEAGVCHGDIKTENVMVTSWTWIVLTDFASFKPTYLPEDDPTDFNTFFASTGGSKRCYLAPERFFSSAQEAEADATFKGLDGQAGTAQQGSLASNSSSSSSSNSSGGSSGGGGGGSAGVDSSNSVSSRFLAPLVPSMDVFSLGCVVAEVFLGAPVLDLPTLLQYRAGGEEGLDAKVVAKLDKLDALASTTSSDSEAAARRSGERGEGEGAALGGNGGSGSGLKHLVLSMLQRDPARRKSVGDYLHRCETVPLGGGGGGEESGEEGEPLFPRSFGSFLYPFMSVLQKEVHTPDERILFLCRHYGAILKRCAGVEDKEGARFFAHYAPKSVPIPGSDLGLRERARQNGGGGGGEAGSSKGLVGDGFHDDTGGDDEEDHDTDEDENEGVYSLGGVSYTGGPALSQSRAVSGEVVSAAEDCPKGTDDEIASLSEETRRLIAELDDHHPPPPLSAAAAGKKKKKPPPPPPPRNNTENGSSKSSSSSSSSSSKDTTGGGGSGSNSLIVVAQLVCSCIRHVRQPQSKLLALELLRRFGKHLDDEARLQRLVPFIVSLLDGPDHIATVRAAAVRALRDVLAMVRRFPASDAELFPKYVYPALQRLAVDPEELVRLAFAESVAGIAETSRRFLETTTGQLALQQATAASAGSESSSAAPGGGGAGAGGGGEGAGKAERFEVRLERLHSTVSKWIHDLVGDMMMMDGAGSLSGSGGGQRSNMVKRALLRDITRLCLFFGATGTEQKILPLLITMINDRDWELRYAFCAHIPALGAFLGPVVTETFIMPLSHPLIVDVEELVVSRCLRCLASLTELGLLQRETMLERASYCAPLLLHPGSWVRHGAAILVAAVARRLGPPDAQAFLFPKLAPFTTVDLAQEYDFLAGGLDPEHDEHDDAPHQLNGSPSPTSVTKAMVGAAASSPVSRRAFKLELLRLAADIRKNPNPQASSSPAPEVEGVGPDERRKLDCMATYLKAAARNLMQKSMQSSSGSGPSSASSSVTSSAAALVTPGGADLSRLQLHAERLNAVPSSSLFVPKSAAAVGSHQLASSGGGQGGALTPSSPTARGAAGGGGSSGSGSGGGESYASSHASSYASSLSLGERDALLATRKAFLGAFLVTHGQRPLSAWSLPREFRDVATVQALHGVTTNSRDAVRLGFTEATHHREDESGHGGAGAGATGGRRGVGVGANNNNRASSMTVMSGTESIDAASLQRRIVALNIPPLPPDFGAPRTSRFFAGGTMDPSGGMGGVSGGGAGGGSSTGGSSAGGGLTSGAAAQAAQAAATAMGKEWRPKVGGVVVQTLMEHVPRDEHGGFRQGPLFSHEHSGAVNRLAVSPDHSFFVSASSDGTCRVWGTAQLEQTVAPRACAVYAQQPGRIMDACCVEGTRSMCSASDQGDVHVWRVDLLGSAGHGGSGGGGNGGAASPRTASGARGGGGGESMGTVEVRRVPLAHEGPVVGVAHFNTDRSSLLLYATQKGWVHGWDLRCEAEPWPPLRVAPELGFLTCIAVGSSGGEKHWLCAGTSRGFLLVWDLRFRLLVRLWRHSSRKPIHRVATCARLPEDPEGIPPQPLAFVAAGGVGPGPELAVWNLDAGGACRRCFRTVVPQEGHALAAAPLPTLDAVPLPNHPDAPISYAGLGAAAAPPSSSNGVGSAHHSVRAIMGRISTNGNSYVITGSTDRHIRFWDLASPSKCFTVSGLDPGQPRPVFDALRVANNGTTPGLVDTFPDASCASSLLVCYDAEVPARHNVVPSHLPLREQRGLVLPSGAHTNAILDLKTVDLPRKMMLSSSRDGVVKCWK